MRKITRAMLHGKPLIHNRPYFDCHRASTSTHEYGLDDPRVFCADTPWDKDVRFNPEARKEAARGNQG